MNSEDEPSRESSPIDEEALLPHDVLWYPDGDVVLGAKPYLFKVHKCILSLQSTVFRDMFAFPVCGKDSLADDAGAMSERYEGLPLVKLEDGGTDVAHLLMTPYDRRYYHRDDDETALEKIISLLVLSIKYDFRGIRLDVVNHIARHYPMTLKEYCDIDDDCLSVLGTVRTLCHFELLSAALKADVDFPLPTLFYACSNLTLVVLYENADFKMDLESLKTLTIGREILRDKIHKIITNLPYMFRRECLKSMCARPSKPCQRSASFSGLDQIRMGSDLDTIRGDFVVDRLNGACADCGYHFANLIDRERRKIWKELPSFFALPSWDILKKRKEKICGRRVNALV